VGGGPPQHDVTFEVSDALTRDFSAGAFDVVYSRDMLLHVSEKGRMFARIFGWLKPGGKLLITDYARWVVVVELGGWGLEWVSNREDTGSSCVVAASC